VNGWMHDIGVGAIAFLLTTAIIGVIRLSYWLKMRGW
jgi:hypothetical protein